MKRHFCIDPVTILISHQVALTHFTKKLRPWHTLILFLEIDFAIRHLQSK